MWLSALVACTQPDVQAHETGCTGLSGPCAGKPLTVTVGTGEFAFAPLYGGADVEFVFGLQGSWHLWVGGEVTAPSQTIAWQSTVIVHDSGAQISGAGEFPASTVLNDWSECQGTFFGARAPVELAGTTPDALDTFICCDLPGETLDITLVVIDLVTGETATSVGSATGSIDAKTLLDVCGSLGVEDQC